MHAGTERGDPPNSAGVLWLKAFQYAPYVPDARPGKAARLRNAVNPTHHAVALVGYEKGPKNRIRKWKIDDSVPSYDIVSLAPKGKSGSDHSRLHMYDDYFRQYVTEVVVPRWAVDPGVLEQMDRRPVFEAKQGR